MVFSRFTKKTDTCLTQDDAAACLNPVRDFVFGRYLGKWFEIAHMEHAREAGRSHPTTHFSLWPDGSIKVTNRSFSVEKNEWREDTGRGSFSGASNVGQFRISFRWPFFKTFSIVDLDSEGYRYSIVAGQTKGEFWIFSRTPIREQEKLRFLVERAGELGCDTKRLVFPSHE